MNSIGDRLIDNEMNAFRSQIASKWIGFCNHVHQLRIKSAAIVSIANYFNFKKNILSPAWNDKNDVREAMQSAIGFGNRAMQLQNPTALGPRFNTWRSFSNWKQITKYTREKPMTWSSLIVIVSSARLNWLVFDRAIYPDRCNLGFIFGGALKRLVLPGRRIIACVHTDILRFLSITKTQSLSALYLLYIFSFDEFLSFLLFQFMVFY